MNPEETGPPLDMLAILSDGQKPPLTVSPSSLTRTIKATMPSKARKYDTSQAVEKLYREHAASLREGKEGLYEKVAFEIYATYRPRIIKIARKYRSLSPIFGEEDLRQEALIAILQALQKYRHSPDVRMKFSTYLEWSIRNIFQRAIGNRDKYVEIYGRDGVFYRTMGYGKFVEQKKALEEAGCTYTTKKRFCYLSEVLLDDDLEAKLDQAGLAPYEYSAYPETPQQPAEMQETEENEESGEAEPGEEEETAAPAADPGSHNGFNIQAIDGLYRQWARSPGKATEGDPIVLRIYDLCRQDSEVFSLPSGNNDAALGADEVERLALSAIARSLASHDDDSVPKIPFSMYLRVAMRRSMQAFRRERPYPEKGGMPPWMSKKSWTF
jgi:RNA polymerase sigma factor (sigma-70 family)